MLNISYLGGYTLDEADGTHRVVEYHSDGKSGLHAVVKRIGHAHHPDHYGHGHEGGMYLLARKIFQNGKLYFLI